MQELKINPEFASLLPPLTEDEFNGLEADIIENGCRDALVVSNGYLIDGHNRYIICEKNHIEFSTVEKAFDSDDDVKIWIWKNQGNRRNISNLVKIELATKMKPILEAKAKERMSLGGLTTHRNQHSKASLQGVEILPPPAENKKVRDELAEQAGVSGRTFDKGVYVLENADEETKDRLRRGEKGLSISGVYNDLKAQEALENQTDDIPVASPEDAEEPFVPDPNSTTPNIPRPDPRTAEEIKATIKANPDLYPRNQVTLNNISKDNTGPLIGALLFGFSETYVENFAADLLKQLVSEGKTKLAKRIVKKVNNVTIS